MTNGAESSPGVPPSYTLRGISGLFIGALVGALLGALVFILLQGPGEYLNNLSDTTSGWGGTQADFTKRLTVVFAFWGAVICGVLGLIAGLFTALGKRLENLNRHNP